MKKDARKLADACRKAARAPLTQVAPGVWMKTDTAKKPPEVVLAHIVDEGEGLYRVVPIFEELVRVDLKLLQLLGMERHRNTLSRLIESGLVEGVKVAPGTTLLNLASWMNHVARCAEDPDLWDAGRGYLEQYREAL